MHAHMNTCIMQKHKYMYTYADHERTGTRAKTSKHTHTLIDICIYMYTYIYTHIDVWLNSQIGKQTVGAIYKQVTQNKAQSNARASKQKKQTQLYTLI